MTDELRLDVCHLLSEIFLHSVFCSLLSVVRSLRRKLLAALVATALQHVTSGLGGHALQEAVLVGAVAFFGLECSLWHTEILTLWSY